MSEFLPLCKQTITSLVCPDAGSGSSTNGVKTVSSSLAMHFSDSLISVRSKLCANRPNYLNV